MGFKENIHSFKTKSINLTGVKHYNCHVKLVSAQQLSFFVMNLRPGANKSVLK